MTSRIWLITGSSTSTAKVVTRGGKTVVTARVAGRFPNSPFDLDHIFEIEGGRISSLEIC